MIWINRDPTMNAIFGAWAKYRINFPGEFRTPFYSMALMDDASIKAVVVYTDYNNIEGTVYMHIAAVPGRKWLTKSFLRAAFEFPFVQSKCRKVCGVVKAKNTDAMNFDLHLGFVQEGRLRKHAYDGDDYIVLGMLREECRWIRKEDAKALSLAA